MDFIYILLVCLFLLLLLSLSLLLNLLLYRSKTRSALSGETLPPGKTGWPVIGESLEFLRWPEKFIGYRMKKYSPHVFKTSLLGEQFAIFCGATGNKFLFSNENKLVQSWWPSSMDKIFPFSEHKSTNEESTKLRKMLPNFFKPNMLERYVGVMHQIAERHFGTRWERENQVVVYPLIKQFTFSNACRLFMSIKDPNDVAQLFCRFDEIAPGMFSMPVDLPGTRFRRAINAANYVRKKILAIIKQRKMDLGEGKALPMQDILSHMLLTTDENGMFMNELDIADKILGLMVAGHESINLTCTSIVKYLAELPHIYDGVYKEQIEILKSKAPGEMLNWDDLQKMKYSWNVACEVLRLSPPIQGTFRESIADFVYNGFLIPKGWKLYWSTNTTHKNPDIFPEPLKFDPLRFEGSGPAPFAFVPFGGGPRMCPGKEYARLELLVFMHHLVKRFKWELLFPNEKIVVYPMPIPVKGLPIRLHPHKA